MKMVTTFKLKVDGDDVVIDSVEEVEKTFKEVEDSAESVNDALDDQKKGFDDVRKSVKELGDESEKSMGKPGDEESGTGDGMLARIGAGVIGAWALKESLVAVIDSIREMAESGDRDMQQVVNQVDSLKASFQQVLIVNSGLAQSLGNYAEGLEAIIDHVNAIASGTTRWAVQQERAEKSSQNIIRMVEEEVSRQEALNDLSTQNLEQTQLTVKMAKEMLSTRQIQGMTEQEILHWQNLLLTARQRENDLIKEQADAREAAAEREAREFWDRKQFQERINSEAVNRRNRQREERQRQLKKIAEEEQEYEKELEKIRTNNFLRQRQRELDMQRQKEQARQAEKEAMNERFAEDQGPAAQLLNQQSTEDVLNRMVEMRGGGQKNRNAVRRDFQRFQQGPRPGESAAEFAKFQQEFAAEGKRAYVKNAAETITTLRKTGRITQEQTKALLMATRELIEQQEEQEKQAREVRNVQRALESLQTRGQQSRRSVR